MELFNHNHIKLINWSFYILTIVEDTKLIINSEIESLSQRREKFVEVQREMNTDIQTNRVVQKDLNHLQIRFKNAMHTQKVKSNSLPQFIDWI